MAFEIVGKVIDVQPVINVSDKFRKREFVIEKKEAGGGGAVFIDYIKFQLVQDKCEIVNESFLHEEVKVSFNIKGNKWEREGKVSYFTNLDAWKVELTSSQGVSEDIKTRGPLEDEPPETEELSDLPF